MNVTDQFHVVLNLNDEIIFDSKTVKLYEIPLLINKYIKHDNLKPIAIMEKVKNTGYASCHCGSTNRGYNIQKI